MRLTFDDFGGPAVTVRDPSGAALSAPEPLIRWAEKSNLRSRKEAAAGWWVGFGPPGLTAQVSPPRTGEYGEFLFEIRLRNTGTDALTGSLLPPFARWAESEAEVSRASAEHILLTASRVVLGTLGRHRSWSAGSEFESDVFTSVPALHAKRYVAAALLADPGEVEHRRDVITLKPGQDLPLPLAHRLRPGNTQRSSARNVPVAWRISRTPGRLLVGPLQRSRSFVSRFRSRPGSTGRGTKTTWTRARAATGWSIPRACPTAFRRL